MTARKFSVKKTTHVCNSFYYKTNDGCYIFSVQVASYVPNFNVKVTNILRVSSVKETMTAGDFNVK